jgi:hypothetical protein
MQAARSHFIVWHCTRELCFASKLDQRTDARLVPLGSPLVIRSAADEKLGLANCLA